MKVSIIIPNWNGKELLKKNLPAVFEAKRYKRNNIAEIIVVDDGSDDDSVAFLRKNFAGKVRILTHEKNKGFSAAINTGAKAARSSLLCLLNTDVIPEKNFLFNTLPHFKDKKVFAVSFHEKGYGYAKGRFEKGFVVHDPVEPGKKAAETFWVNGGSGIFRRSVWRKLKGMDEVLLSPLYWEDIDLSYRALKRGYKLLWEPNAMVSHKHESTVKKLPQNKIQLLQERNQLLFIWKNITSQNLLKKHINGLLTRIAAHPGYIKVIFAAIKKIKTVKKARKVEKKEAKLSDEAVFAKFS